MSPIPTDPNQRLTRKQTAQALTEAGYPITDTYLATIASRGNGPPDELFGQRALYRWSKVLQWAQSRLSAPHRKGGPLNSAETKLSTSSKTTARQPPRPGKRAEAERREPDPEVRP